MAAAASPDGLKVVLSYQGDIFSPSEVWLVNADGRDARKLFDMAGDVSEFAWSPDGKKIAVLGDGWMVMDADGANLRKLGDFGAAQCFFLSPLWSPDSLWLAIVVSTRTGSCDIWSDEMFKETNILLVDSESGESHPLLPDGSTGNLDPAWSPDGSQVAFVSYRSGAPGIWIVNLDGSHLRPLTQDSLPVRFPYWRRP